MGCFPNKQVSAQDPITKSESQKNSTNPKSAPSSLTLGPAPPCAIAFRKLSFFWVGGENFTFRLRGCLMPVNGYICASLTPPLLHSENFSIAQYAYLLCSCLVWAALLCEIRIFLAFLGSKPSKLYVHILLSIVHKKKKSISSTIFR